MKAHRSRRAWLPAAVASVTMLVGLAVLNVVNHLAYDDRLAPTASGAPLWRWLAETYDEYFGADALSTRLGGRVLFATLAAGVVLLVVAYLGSWVAVRALAPGSGLLPVFLSIWMVLVIASVAGLAAMLVVRAFDEPGGSLGQREFSVFVTGIGYGMKWGWIAALLASIVWLVVRPRPDVLPAGHAVAPESSAPTAEEETYRDGYSGEYSTGRYAGPYAEQPDKSVGKSAHGVIDRGTGGAHKDDTPD